MVFARTRAAAHRFCTVVRPGGVLALATALAAFAGAALVRPFRLPLHSVGQVAISVALPPLHHQLLVALLAFGAAVLALGWWLPDGRHTAQWSLVALAGLVAPLFLADALQAACALLLAAAALAPVLAHGDDDAPVALFLGSAALGVACLVVGLLVAQSTTPATWSQRLGPARILVLVGLALLLGVAPAPLWLPGVVRRAHPVGAALAAGGFPIVVMTIALLIARSERPFEGWLVSASDGQMVSAAGAATMIVASAVALSRRDVRQIAGLLLAADLGFMTVGAGLGVTYDAALYPIVLLPLAARAIGVAVLLPALTLVTSGFRCALRPALVLLLACGAAIVLGGPLTPGYALRAEILWIAADISGALGAAILAGAGLMAVVWIVLVVRAWRLPLAESARPCPRLALLLMGALAAGSLLL